MYKILKKRVLNEQTILMEIEAPYIVKHAEAGQFVILRVREGGERVPFTIAGCDVGRGAVSIIFQILGKTTILLARLEAGDEISDIVGPLGMPTELEGYKKAVVIGGGLGVAIAYPIAKKLSELGTKTDVIAGFRNQELIILEDEFRTICDNTMITTDDKGFVTDVLRDIVTDYDLVVAIGPLVMMRAVAEMTRPHGIKTIVSMNPIMVDGTGMCGGCRVTVGGEMKFACVDGPDFDGHLVDFDEAMRRSGIYREEEHICRIGVGNDE